VSLPLVGVDAHHLARPEGNRAYVRTLLLGLARALPDDLDVVIYGDPAAVAAVAPGVPARRLPLAARAALRVPLGVPWVQRRDRPALWHAAWTVAPWAPAPLALVVHDVLFATHPELFSRRAGLRLRALVAPAARRAARVLVPTRATRDALRRWLPDLDPARLAVVPLGLDLDTFRPDGPAPAEALAPYILAVGRPDRRKGLQELVRAFARVRHPRARLVLAGPLGPATDTLRAEAARARLAPDRLTLIDEPDDLALAALYRGAVALAFPSRAEGVGLPVLEALACGARVVASRLPAVVEVLEPLAPDGLAGGRAALVPVGDEGALVAALEVALEAGRPATPVELALPDAASLARGTLAVWREALSATG
jgi:glycosyltransferase involved in cell wall biosynthesis